MRFLFNNFGLKLLALALASAISGYVYTEIDYPVPDTLFLPVKARNLRPSLILSGPLPETVTVRVRGPYRGIRRLRALNLAATLNLSGIEGPTSERVPIQVPGLGEVVVASVEPDSALVEVDGREVLRLPLVADKRGQLDPNFTIAQESWDEPSVKISGPQSVIERVARAQIEPNLSSLSRDMKTTAELASTKLSVNLYDEGGARVISPAVTIEPAVVEYKVRIAPVDSVRVLKVVCENAGQPPEGYVLVGCSAAPSYVAVPKELAGDGVTALRTQPVNLGGKKESFVAQTKLLYPFALPKDSDLPKQADVTVEIAALEDQAAAATGVPIELNGAAEEYDYSLDPPQLRVVSEELAGLAADSRRKIRAELQVAGLRPGDYRIIPQVSLPPELDSARIVPTSVTLTVIEKGK